MKPTFHPLDTIRRKRDNLPLSPAEIQSLVRAVVARQISDAQIAAFLMAVFLNGLSTAELNALTEAMRFSGETFDPSPLHTFTVDKHSTGGVGDKTSLLIAPIIAAAGLRNTPSISIPMISGRSLGHTGGTLDKLETIPGFNTQLSLLQMSEVLAQTHAALVGQTPNLVPADRILYALRDHTSTVESPFLICASIMSKKLAAGLNALVLDVKTGSGAFMHKIEDAKFLAELMVRTGEAAGTRTVALLTSMDQPLGRFAGNWIEVQECVDILRNRSHPLSADLVDISLQLSGHMLHLAHATSTPEAGTALARDLLQSGKAYQSWLQIVEAQGGDTSVFNFNAASLSNPASPTRSSLQPRNGVSTPSPSKPSAFSIYTRILQAEAAGYLNGMDCAEVGWAVQRLGAGRLNPGDPVSTYAGIEMHAKLGDRLEPNQPLITLFAEDPALLDEPEQMLRSTLRIEAAPPTPAPLIREIITAANIAQP